MRFATIVAAACLSSACASVPDARHPLVVHYNDDGSFWVKSNPAPPMADVDDSTPLPGQKFSVDALGSFIRTQLYWIGSKVQLRFAIQDHKAVEIDGARRLLFRVGMTQPSTSRHGDCTQEILVVTTVEGQPLSAYVGEWATCVI